MATAILPFLLAIPVETVAPAVMFIYNTQRELSAADGIEVICMPLGLFFAVRGILIRPDFLDSRERFEMRKLMGWSGLLGLATLLLLLATTVAGPAGETSSAFAADKGSWKNVTVLYLNDVKGKIEPCG